MKKKINITNIVLINKQVLKNWYRKAAQLLVVKLSGSAIV